MGQSGTKGKKSIWGYLAETEKARGAKRSSTDAKTETPPKRDAWHKNPGFHLYQPSSVGGVCTSCKLQEERHRREGECYTEYLIRMGR